MFSRISKLAFILIVVTALATTGCQTGGLFGFRSAQNDVVPTTNPSAIPSAYTSAQNDYQPSGYRGQPARVSKADDNCSFG